MIFFFYQKNSISEYFVKKFMLQLKGSFTYITFQALRIFKFIFILEMLNYMQGNKKLIYQNKV